MYTVRADVRPRLYRVGSPLNAAPLLATENSRTAWGGLDSRRGGTYNTGVASYEDGIEQIQEIAKRPIQHGYRDTRYS